MKHVIGIVIVTTLLSCNSGHNSKTQNIPDSLSTKKDSIVEVSSLSDLHRDARENIVRTWRIYKDVSREGEKCDSNSIQSGDCLDKNTEIITLVTFGIDGKYTLKSGFRGNYPEEDNGTWKLVGTKYGVDLLLLESHTEKEGVGPDAKNSTTTYIIQLVSSERLVFIDADMFNTMYFIPEDSRVR
jgi:hypothetical protein